MVSTLENETVLIERGMAPALWAVYLHERAGRMPTRKNVIRTAQILLEIDEEIPECVIVESNLLIERMEYENSQTFDWILDKLAPKGLEGQRRLGIEIALASARIGDGGLLLDWVQVPEINVIDAFANEFTDPFMDSLPTPLQVAAGSSNSGWSLS